MTNDPIRAAVISGSIAFLATLGTLASRAPAEGKGALQPANASAHWLAGRRAARPQDFDAQITPLGLATNWGASVFWAVLFETLRGPRPTGLQTVSRAIAASSIAAGVDYNLVPRRLTPGWELVLSKASVARSFAALAAGLIVGGLVSRR